MNQLVEKYGRVVIICMVSGIVLGVLGIFGTKLYQKSYYAEGGNANDLGEEIKVLGEQGKHPFFPCFPAGMLWLTTWPTPS